MTTNNTQAEDVLGMELAPINQFSNALDRLAMFSEKPENELKELSSTYLTLDENQTYDFICTGLTVLNLQDKEVEAATLINADGESFTCGAAVLVSSVKKVEAKYPSAWDEGKPLRIVTGSKVKSPKGSYLDMKVYTI
jgi:hypothetical protein